MYSKLHAEISDPFFECRIDDNAQEVLAMTRRMAEILARHTGQPVEQVMLDIDRDRFMTPDEAVSYGLIDNLIERKALAA
ncbi:MAG TPA: ATP-dependent Clp protease proteolytic subunit [Chitinophagaceae bacterium]